MKKFNHDQKFKFQNLEINFREMLHLSCVYDYDDLDDLYDFDGISVLLESEKIEVFESKKQLYISKLFNAMDIESCIDGLYACLEGYSLESYVKIKHPNIEIFSTTDGKWCCFVKKGK